MPQEKPRCPDGQIDWYAVNVLHGGKAYAKHASSFKGFKIFHQVRHPLKVIGSACTFPMPEWEYVSRLIPGIQDDPAPLRTMRYWYHWNILAEEKAEWTGCSAGRIGSLLGQIWRPLTKAWRTR
jgi:hypothetical protein